MTAGDLTWPVPDGGWPAWVRDVPYDAARHPLAQTGPIERGANCQRYAYAVVGLFGLEVPPLRSSDLWERGPQVAADELEPLDLVLVNGSAEAYGAHVGVVLGPDAVLHLCAEVGRPAVWGWADLAARERYAVVLGGVRPAGVSPPPDGA
ncbi:hypothetical protein Bcav_3952 [Beutenbergia cavernae DSM 12333]|uniref:NlpC/P60 domain-containing protein n=1 Tax=Beutenbergia cavernae (strain ATCC BAA-8 / DSM 12333 / CCUG 43141 / JCM 11478 / NBRC 16432 / NCIMB 13614 / HKI 0122) TaxID=471853 RepID=C5C553_BEUC1|nr:C40 family peptidase [Beutenbergia cavernae]ACQ82193.1 hypothetical protein Bcav_3952 [Beutenbergia cavernae DSM 12333]